MTLEGLRGVQRHGGERDKCTQAHQSPHPELKISNVYRYYNCFNIFINVYTHLVHPFDVRTLVQALLRTIVGQHGLALQTLLSTQHGLRMFTIHLHRVTSVCQLNSLFGFGYMLNNTKTNPEFHHNLNRTKLRKLHPKPLVLRNQIRPH